MCIAEPDGNAKLPAAASATRLRHPEVGRTRVVIADPGRDQEAATVITWVYLFLDSLDTCAQRVKERVQKGGHSVADVDIRRRFLRSIRNFWQLYRPLAGHWPIAYNPGKQPLDVAVGVTYDRTVTACRATGKIHAVDRK